MAEKRNRQEIATSVPDAIKTDELRNSDVPGVGRADSPEAAAPTQPDSGIDALMKRFDEQEKRNREQDETIRVLKKEIAAAKGDISEDNKESKRRYGYELDGHTRRQDEPFEFGFKTVVHDRKEKAVVKTETIGRPVTNTDFNKGKRSYLHDITVTFSDGTSTEMDAIDFINQCSTEKAFVPDSDIRVYGGVKHYTFRTEKYGTFEVSEKFVN